MREVNAVAVRPGGGGLGRPGEVVARLSPVRLPASSRVRLARVAPRAILKDDPPELQVPLRGGAGLPGALAGLLGELFPDDTAPDAGSSRPAPPDGARATGSGGAPASGTGGAPAGDVRSGAGGLAGARRRH